MELAREISFRFPLCRGEDVRAVQQALTIVQSEPPCGTVDGIFGGATRQAVSEFQRRSGLAVDGVVARVTWDALLTAAAARQESLPENARSSLVGAAVNAVAAPAVTAGTAALGPAPAELPVNERQGRRARDWLFDNYGSQIRAGVAGTAFDDKLVAAIACKETANVWLSWIDRLAAAQVLARCVFDGSGDVPGTSRSAFPRNAAAFRADPHAGDALTDMLIDEANETRKLRGLAPQRWLYKGYGIFQYDLQHFTADPDFFKQRGWSQFDACMERLLKELQVKLKAANGDVADAVRRYNGSGPRAEQYRDHVMYMRQWF